MNTSKDELRQCEKLVFEVLKIEKFDVPAELRDHFIYHASLLSQAFAKNEDLIRIANTTIDSKHLYENQVSWLTDLEWLRENAGGDATNWEVFLPTRGLLTSNLRLYNKVFGSDLQEDISDKLDDIRLELLRPKDEAEYDLLQFYHAAVGGILMDEMVDPERLNIHSLIKYLSEIMTLLDIMISRLHLEAMSMGAREDDNFHSMGARIDLLSSTRIGVHFCTSLSFSLSLGKSAIKSVEAITKGYKRMQDIEAMQTKAAATNRGRGAWKDEILEKFVSQQVAKYVHPKTAEMLRRFKLTEEHKTIDLKDSTIESRFRAIRKKIQERVAAGVQQK